jgi:type I restriction enzyme, S subunit
VKRALPAGWSWSTVGDLASDVRYGSSSQARADIEGVAVLRMGNIVDGHIQADELKYLPSSHPEFPTLFLEEGDLLFNRTNSAELVGKTAVYAGVPHPCSFASYLIRVRLRKGFEPKLLAYYINSPMGREWIASVVTQQVGQANVNGTKLKALAVPTPPAKDQKRLVSVIELQFSRIDAGVAALQRAKANLKRYRASVLKAACEGRLVATEAELARRESRDYEPASVLLQRVLKERRHHWEASELAKLKAKGKPPTDDRWKAKYKEPESADATKLPRLPEGWCWTTIDAVADLTIGFAFKSTGFVDEGIRLLRGENIEPGRLRWLDTRCWPTTDSFIYENLLVQEGDVILAMDRPVVSAGLKLAQAKSSDIPCLLVQRVARLRLFNGDNRLLFMTMSEDRFIRHVVVGGQTGTQLPHVSGSRIANYPVALPPAAEQERVISEVQRRLSTVEHSETAVNADLARAERLRQSILQAAFEGRLTPLGGAERPNPGAASGSNVKRRATAALMELADA